MVSVLNLVERQPVTAETVTDRNGMTAIVLGFRSMKRTRSAASPTFPIDRQTEQRGREKGRKRGELPSAGVHRPASRQSTGGRKMVPKSRPTCRGLRTMAIAVGSGQAAAVELLAGVFPSATGSGGECWVLRRQREGEANTSGRKARGMLAARVVTQVTAVEDGLWLGGPISNEGIDGCRACRRWIPATSRPILKVSTGLSRRWLHQTTAQMPCFIHSRRGLAFASQNNATSAPSERPPTSKSSMPKVLLGGALLGGIFAVAYQAGYIKKPQGKDKILSLGSGEFATATIALEHETQSEEVAVNLKTGEISGSHTVFVTRKEESVPTPPNVDEQQTDRDENKVQDEAVKDTAEESNSFLVTDLPESSISTEVQDLDTPSEVSKDEGLHAGKMEYKIEPCESDKENSNSSEVASHHEAIGKQEASENHLNPQMLSKENVNTELEMEIPLSDAYLLQERGFIGENLKGEAVSDAGLTYAKRKEDSALANEESNNAGLPSDGKIILDFIEAIHAAEKKQAEQDAKTYAEQKRKIKEKYEKELKDARARELMNAEEAALLDKELNRERAKAAAALKSLQEKTDEKLKLELQQKEEESVLQLKNTQELAKAEMATAIAKEKAYQIERMAEAYAHIDALCMAFFAKSKESCQRHTAHKLALAVIALEDALSKGLPVQAELNTLYSSLEGTGTATNSDSLLNVVFTSLPKDTLERGVDTPLQLNQKFDALKAVLRHYVLIPAGGGGMLAHVVAHVASMIKMKEDGQYGASIESVISRVDNLLAEGKLTDAADLLESSVHGSEAADVVVKWVQQARNRAIVEQALTLLQSLATSTSLADF